MAMRKHGCSPDSFSICETESIVDEECETNLSDGGSSCAASSEATPSLGPAASSSDRKFARTLLSGAVGPQVDIRNDDVLLGRGKFANNRSGNRYYRYLLVGNCDAYAQCTNQKAKVAFTTLLVTEVKVVGRFLQPVKGGKYRVISDAKARVKAGQDLRYQAKQKRIREKAAAEDDIRAINSKTTGLSTQSCTSGRHLTKDSKGNAFSGDLSRTLYCTRDLPIFISRDSGVSTAVISGLGSFHEENGKATAAALLHRLRRQLSADLPESVFVSEDAFESPLEASLLPCLHEEDCATGCQSRREDVQVTGYSDESALSDEVALFGDDDDDDRVSHGLPL